MSDEMSRHDKRMENGFVTIVVLGFIGGAGYGLHALFGLVTVGMYIGALIGVFVGLYALIWFVGVLVTDVPARIARWFR